MPNGEGMPFVDDESTVRMASDAATVVGHNANIASGALPALDVSDGLEAQLRVTKLLGKGGMGHVHLAEQRALGREVAVKRPLHKGSGDASRRDALLVEGRITGQLEHPNIIPIHMLGSDVDGAPVVVMKRVEGVSWAELIGKPTHDAWRFTHLWMRAPLVRHLEILRVVADAIEFAHTQGVLHRDLKPQNVMVGAFGQIYVLDWGLATDIGTGSFAHALDPSKAFPVGTPGYMAPEMVAHDGVLDARTDVYLLGATLHRAIVGRARHPGRDLARVMDSVRRSQAFDYGDGVPAEVAALCNKAMHRLPEQRFQTVAELRGSVMLFLDHQSSLALTDKAEGLATQLEQEIGAAAHAGEDGAGPSLARTFTECRFAFAQALAQWAQNARAKVGFQRCLETMIRYEVTRGNAIAAGELLSELPEADSELLDEVARLRDAQSHERQDVQKLREMADDLDLSVSRTQRMALMIAIVVAVGVGSVAYFPPSMFGGVVLTPLLAVMLVLKTAAVFVVAVLIARKWLFRNAINRAVVGLIVVGLFCVTVNRVGALFIAVPMTYVLTADLVIGAAVSAAGAMSITRGLFAMTGLYLAGVTAALSAPMYAGIAFTATQMLAFTAGAAWITGKGAPRAAHGASGRGSERKIAGR